MTIKEAVMERLEARIAYNNDGMFSRVKESFGASKLLVNEGVTIEGDTVYRKGAPMFKIERRYSSKKIKGCYRELKPKLVTIEG